MNVGRVVLSVYAIWPAHSGPGGSPIVWVIVMTSKSPAHYREPHLHEMHAPDCDCETALYMHECALVPIAGLFIVFQARSKLNSHAVL